MSLYEAVNEKLKVVGTGMLQSRKVHKNGYFVLDIPKVELAKKVEI